MDAAFLIVIGLVLLTAGGEALVRGAVGAAQSLGVSPLMIGLTLVGFGTSAPELVTSLQAAFDGAPGIAVGNVAGSNIANVLLILGVAAVIAPVAVDPKAFARDGLVLALVTALGVGAFFYGSLGRPVGALLLGALAAYLVITWLQERRATPPRPEADRHVHEAEFVAPKHKTPVWRSLLVALGGLVITVLGARLLVSGAVQTAQAFGVSDTVIGLTVVAVGTSLPELVTSVVAALRRQSDVALGNIVGSNIYNILGILGVTALVHPIPVPAEILRVDVWVMAASAAALIVFARTGWRVGRREGAALLAAYAAYIGWLAVGAV